MIRLYFAAALLLLTLPLLDACVGVAVKGAKTAVTEGTIAVNQKAADRGDAAAEYEVGAAHCCAIGPLDPIHDNTKATTYLCRAARQDYVPAQLLLGRIYAGRPVVGFDPQQSAKLLLTDQPRNLAVAALWLTRAARDGNADARKALADLPAKLTAADEATVLGWLADWRSAPCEWQTVFPAAVKASWVRRQRRMG
jgi:hypothetical protein